MSSQLPPEIWIEIFRWAVYDSYTDSFFATEYVSFHWDTLVGSYVLDESLEVKWALVRVCRQWKSMAMDMLYEDVRIRHGEQALAEALDSTGESAGYGKWVQRIELPYSNNLTTLPQFSGGVQNYKFLLGLQCGIMVTLTPSWLQRSPYWHH